MDRKGWYFLIVVFSIMFLLLVIREWVSDGMLGEEWVWLKSWIMPVYAVIIISLVLIFRKTLLAWENSGNK